jgi:hypothetical protein
MTMDARTRLRWSLLLSLGCGAGALACIEEPLGQLRPIGSLCALVPDEPPVCDEVLALGEVPVSLPTTLTPVLLNRGNGRLLVQAVTIDGQNVTLGAVPEVVAPGDAVPIELLVELPATALGPHEVALRVESNDALRSPHEVVVRFDGVPRPLPQVELCDPVTGTCAADLVVDLGVVRRFQPAGRVVELHNRGDGELCVEEVARTDTTSAPDEFRIDTPLRPGCLPPGSHAELAIAYTPADDVEDTLELVFHTDDPQTPTATLTIIGTSAQNDPPVAVARAVTLDEPAGALAVAVLVDDLVLLDGTGSSDPEGDPLRHRWEVEDAAGVFQQIGDATAAIARFLPRRRGTFVARLVVEDSLGQQSAPATVQVEAAPRNGLAVELSWDSHGDLDLYLIEAGADPFTGPGCRFDQRTFDVGTNGEPEDDCALVDDATAAPGLERIVIQQPAAGSWSVFVQTFDLQGGGAVEAAVAIVLDDDPVPVFAADRSLPSACALWHVADIELPAGTVTPFSSPLGLRCR